jgi:hypothetical protein
MFAVIGRNMDSDSSLRESGADLQWAALDRIRDTGHSSRLILRQKNR